MDHRPSSSRTRTAPGAVTRWPSTAKTVSSAPAARSSPAHMTDTPVFEKTDFLRSPIVTCRRPRGTDPVCSLPAALKRKAEPEPDENPAGCSVKRRHDAGAAKPAGKRPGRTREQGKPDDALRRVNGRKQHAERSHINPGRDEQWQEGRVEHSHLGGEDVRAEPANQPAQSGGGRLQSRSRPGFTHSPRPRAWP